MPTIDWPLTLIPFQPRIPVLEKNIASAGTSLTGQERFIATDAGRWRYGFRLGLRKAFDALAWRALLVQTGGRSNLIRVPIYDFDADPATVNGIRQVIDGGNHIKGIRHSDGTLFGDGSSYNWSLANGIVSTAGVQGATSISVTMPTGLRPDPGQYFSDGNRLYQVNTSTLSSGTTYALTFLPRMRATIAVGASISFDRLFCLMRIADENAFSVDLDQAGFGDVEINFTEALV